MNLSEQFSERDIENLNRAVKRYPSRRKINCILLFLLFTFAVIFVCSIMYLNQAYYTMESLGSKGNPFSFISHIDPDKLYPGRILRIYKGVTMFLILVCLMIPCVFAFMLYWLLRKNTLNIKCFRTVLGLIEKEKSGINEFNSETQ